jgi:hypothetical protein
VGPKRNRTRGIDSDSAGLSTWEPCELVAQKGKGQDKEKCGDQSGSKVDMQFVV